MTPRTPCHVDPNVGLIVVTVFAFSALPISNRGRIEVWPTRKLRFTSSPSRLKRASRYHELVGTSAMPSEAVHCAAVNPARHVDRFRPSAGAITEFGAFQTASVGMPGLFWQLALTWTSAPN